LPASPVGAVRDRERPAERAGLVVPAGYPPGPHARALDLAAGGLVELIGPDGHDGRVGDLHPPGEVGAHPTGHGVVRGIGGHEQHGDAFDALVVGHAERRHVADGHALDLAGRVLDLVAEVVHPVDDDDFLGAAGDRHPAVVQEGEVAGVEPVAVRESLPVRLGVVQIAGQHPVRSHLQPADVPLRQRGPAVRPGHPHPAARRGRPHAQQRAVAVGGPVPHSYPYAVGGHPDVLGGRGVERLVGDDRAGLGHAPREQQRARPEAVTFGPLGEPAHDRFGALLAGVDQGADVPQVPLPGGLVAQRLGHQLEAEVR
jgi:hypothetical protein